MSGYGGVKVTFELESGGTFEATLAEMGLDAPDLKETVAQAAKYGYSGNAVSAYKTLKKAEKGKLRHTIPLKYAVSEKETGEILDTRSSELFGTAAECLCDSAGWQRTSRERKAGRASGSCKDDPGAQQLAE